MAYGPGRHAARRMTYTCFDFPSCAEARRRVAPFRRLALARQGMARLRDSDSMSAVERPHPARADAASLPATGGWC